MCGTKDTWKLGEQAQEFFVYATLGIIPEKMFKNSSHTDILSKIKGFENEDVNYKVYCIFMCTKAAYNDLSRTLRYEEKYKSNSKDKNALKEKEQKLNCICAELTKTIYNNDGILSNPEKLFNVLVDKEGNYRNCVNDLFVCLKEDEKDNLKFHFGQVQKWINMTLKYLYLLGIVENDNELHIPIDSYIMKALSDKGVKFPKQNGDMKEYSDINSVKWSRLNRHEYESIVEGYQNTILEDDPINWEHTAWIKQSEKEKGFDIY